MLYLYTFEAYRTRAVAACILNWQKEVSGQHHAPASLPQSQPCFLKKKKPLGPARTRTPICQAHTLITIPNPECEEYYSFMKYSEIPLIKYPVIQKS